MTKVTFKEFFRTEILSTLSQIKPSEKIIDGSQISQIINRRLSKFDDDDIFKLLTSKEQRQELLEIIHSSDVGFTVNMKTLLVGEKFSKSFRKIISSNIYYVLKKFSRKIGKYEFVIDENCLQQTKNYFLKDNFQLLNQYTSDPTYPGNESFWL